MITKITADSPPTVTASRRTNRRVPTRTVLVSRHLEDLELERWLRDCASLLAEQLGGCRMSPNPPLNGRRRVAIYTRARDDEGLRRQREDVERHIAQHPNLAVVAVYEEVQLPVRKRPALDRLLADAGNGAFDVIAVRDVARLARSMQDFARIVQPLRYRGVDIVTAVEKVDTSTAAGRFMMTVVNGFIISFMEAQSRDSRDAG